MKQTNIDKNIFFYYFLRCRTEHTRSHTQQKGCSMTPKQQQELYQKFMNADSQLQPADRLKVGLKGILLIEEDFEICITGAYPKDPRVHFTISTSSQDVGNKIRDFFSKFKLKSGPWASHLETAFDDELNEYFHYFAFEW